MAHSVLHNYVNPQPDDGDPNVTGPDEWNEQHVILIDPSLISHGGLDGLAANDHPQYFLTSNAAALTRTNDTNVTVTLGGTPATALLNAVSLTLGWTGTLAVARGGTNANLSATGGTGQYLKQISAGASITVGTIAAADLPGSFSGFANPTGTVGLTAVNGTATTAMRSDAAPPLDQGITPTWTGVHLASASYRNSSYIRIGSTSAATITTAGTVTAERFIAPDGVSTTTIGTRMNLTSTTTSTTASSAAAISLNVDPTGTASSPYSTLVLSATSQGNAATISEVTGLTVNAAASTSGASGATTTSLRGVAVNLSAIGLSGTSTITTAVAFDVGPIFIFSGGTIGTSVGLRISGSNSPAIAIQSLGGHHRFVGAVQIGQNATPSVELSVFAGTTPRIHLHSTSSGSTSTDGFQLALSTLDAYLWNFENAPIHFATNNTERLTISAAGSVNAAIGFQVAGAAALRAILMGDGTNFVSSNLTWTTYVFNAADFTASVGNWTVDSADVVNCSYFLIGKTMVLSYNFNGTDVSSTPLTLRFAIPGGFTAARQVDAVATAINAGTTWEFGQARADAGLTYIQFFRNGAANWSTTAADNTGVRGQIIFEVQ